MDGYVGTLKLLTNGINGNVYNVIKAIYKHPENCVLLNDKMMDWFPVWSCARQGDSLSPILFPLFMNDLAEDFNHLGKDIQIDDVNLSLLMCADDLAILSDSPENAQELLDVMTKWCNTWGMISNIRKSQVVHHRNHHKRR